MSELNVLPDFLRDALQCPVTGTPLKHQKDRLTRADGTFYPIVKGIPKLTFSRGMSSEDREPTWMEAPLRLVKSAWNGCVNRALLGFDFRQERERIVSTLGLKKGMTVLEVAPGDGCFHSWIREAIGPSGAYVVVDRSRRVLESCRNLSGKSPMLIQSFGHSLPFKSGTFDAALCLNGVRYLKEPDMAMTDIVRVVKPGGRVAWLGVEPPKLSKSTWTQRLLYWAYPDLVWDKPEAAPGVSGFEVKDVFKGKAYLAVGYKK